jgi:hypothetical protein
MAQIIAANGRPICAAIARIGGFSSNRRNQMTIKIIDAIAGAGKTHAIIKRAIDLTRLTNKPVAIVLPTIGVIDEKYRDALARAGDNIMVRRVDSSVSEASGKTVGTMLDEALREIGNQPALLFVTHCTFLDCANWVGAQDWTFFIDELYDPVSVVSYKVPRSYGILTDHLELLDPGARYSEVQARRPNGHRFTLFGDGSDDAERMFKSVADCLAQPGKWLVYVETENYRAVTSEIGKSRNAETRDRAAQLAFYIVARPWFDTAGLNVSMASACFTDRLLFRLWSNPCAASSKTEADRVALGRARAKLIARFEPDHAVMKKLCATEHNGQGLILDCLDLAHWSTWAKNGGRHLAKGEAMPDDAPQRVLEALIAKQFAGHPFLYTANSNWQPVEGFEQGEKLNLISHGRNEFSHHTRVAFMPSTLPTPDKWKFLDWLGVSDAEIRDEYVHTHAYQAVFRSAARRLDRTEEICAILPSRAVCEYIGKKAPGAVFNVHPLSTAPNPRGRPRTHSTAQSQRDAHALSTWLQRNPEKSAADYVPRRGRSS